MTLNAIKQQNTLNAIKQTEVTKCHKTDRRR